MIGVEAAGQGIETGQHAATLTNGRPGVLHGNRTYLMQDENGQIIETHSISAGLDYPGVGPEHAWLKDSKRAEYVGITDDEALEAFHACAITKASFPRWNPAMRWPMPPSLRPRSAATNSCWSIFPAAATRIWPPWRRPPISLFNRLRTFMSRIATVFDKLRQQNRKALIPFITAGDPEPAMMVPLMHELVKAGADIIELGVPFSDPMADGPTIQRSSERALKHHVEFEGCAGDGRGHSGKATRVTPVVLMGYANPIEAMGYEVFAQERKQCGIDGVLTVDYPPEESAEWVEYLEASKSTRFSCSLRLRRKRASSRWQRLAKRICLLRFVERCHRRAQS